MMLMIAVTASLFGTALAQETVGDELAKLRTIYEKELARTTLPLMKKYERALSMREERQTKTGNLDSALAIREERLRIEAEISAAQLSIGKTAAGSTTKGGFAAILVETKQLKLKVRSKVYAVEFFENGEAIWHYRDGLKLHYDWAVKGSRLAMSRERQGEGSESRFIELRVSIDKNGNPFCKGKKRA